MDIWEESVKEPKRIIYNIKRKSRKNVSSTKYIVDEKKCRIRLKKCINEMSTIKEGINKNKIVKT